MLQLACLWLALNEGNDNSIQLKKSAVRCVQFTLSLHFIPGPQPAVCSLPFTLTDET